MTAVGGIRGKMVVFIITRVDGDNLQIVFRLGVVSNSDYLSETLDGQ